MDKLTKLEALLDAPAAVPAAAPAVTAALDPDETVEQQAVRLGGECAARLVQADPGLARAFAAMLAFRRCYAVAYRELADRLDAAPAGTVQPMTLDVLVGAAMHEAAQPFSEHTLMDSVITTVMPWLADAVDQHTAADVEADRAARAEADAARRAAAIPLGFDPHVVPPAVRADPDPDAGAILHRDRGLVLVGWGPAVAWLLRRIGTHVLEATALQTLIFAQTARPEDQHARQRRLAGPAWAGMCNTKEALLRATVLAGAHQGRPVDLLICTDLTRAYTRSYTGRPRGATAGDAYRRLDQFARDYGCGLIGAIPLETAAAADLHTPEYEQLRTFAHLRQVLAEPGDAGYRVRCGQLDEVVPAGALAAVTPRIVLQ